MSAKADSMTRMSMEFKVANKLGLHARPAAVFVKTASRFDCEILVEKDGQKVSGKSLISLLLLAVAQGCKVTIHAHGADAPLAMAELRALVERRFGEAE